jgi:hypothetical protein
VATADSHAVPQVFFTDPEAAAVGLTARQAERAGYRVRVVDVNMGESVPGANLYADGYAMSAGCANSGNQAPPPTTTTTTTTATTSPSPSSAAPVSPTEKGLSPTAGNSFAPQVLAPPAPTEPPGVHRHR